MKTCVSDSDYPQAVVAGSGPRTRDRFKSVASDEWSNASGRTASARP